MFSTAFQANAFQNDAFQIVITPLNPKQGGDDAWTPEEKKRYKALQKKLRKAEEKRIAALKADAENRKKIITDLVDPKPVVQKQQNKVQSNQEVSADIPSDLTKFDATIARLVKEQEQLVQAAFYRNELARIQTQLAILEAQRVQNLDDEEALLLLL